MIGAFCNFNVNSKQRETNGFRSKQPLVREKRCVTTLITAAKETMLEWDEDNLAELLEDDNYSLLKSV